MVKDAGENSPARKSSWEGTFRAEFSPEIPDAADTSNIDNI